MKKNQNLESLQKLNKEHLINELTKSSIKGGCCTASYTPGGELVDWYNPETGDVVPIRSESDID